MLWGPQKITLCWWVTQSRGIFSFGKLICVGFSNELCIHLEKDLSSRCSVWIISETPAHIHFLLRVCTNGCRPKILPWARFPFLHSLSWLVTISPSVFVEVLARTSSNSPRLLDLAFAAHQRCIYILLIDHYIIEMPWDGFPFLSWTTLLHV